LKNTIGLVKSNLLNFQYNYRDLEKDIVRIRTLILNIFNTMLFFSRRINRIISLLQFIVTLAV